MPARKRDCWIGFDLGGTKMMAVVYNAAFKPLGRSRRRTKAHEGMRAGLERVQRTVNEALEDARVDVKRIAGLGIGIPGPLDPETGMVIQLPNLGWRRVQLGQTLTKALGCPVAVANDVDAGTYGESCFGAAKGAASVLGVFPGTGIGGGFVLNGAIVSGRHITCLEIGHLTVLPGGPLCGCGKRGCLEAVASRLAIASAAAAAACRGQAPHLLRLAGGMDLANIRSGVLAQAMAAGDAVIADIVHDAARWLGIGIGNVVNLLAPEVVVLGGGLVEALPVSYRAAAQEAARETCMPVFRRTFKVVTAKLGDDAVTLGAAAWVRREVSP